MGQFGRDVNCTGCGSPRPKGIRFYLPEDAPEVTDAARLEQARAGADWVCEHCGASARATDDDCPGCGAPRGSSPTQVTRRYGGGEVPRGGGAAPIQAAAALPPRPKKSRGGRTLAGALAVLVGFCAWTNRTRNVEAVVAAKEWQREVQVEEHRTVTESDWSLPSGGSLVRSYRDVRDWRQVIDHYETRTRQVSERVQTGTEQKVCGQRDNGNGYFEDVYCNEPVYETRYRTEEYQEPVYRREPIYATKYEYRIKRWVPDTLLAARGAADPPRWPAMRLDDDQREGEKKQRYVLTFRDGDDTYTAEVPLEAFAEHDVGERVRLLVKGKTVQLDTAQARSD